MKAFIPDFGSLPYETLIDIIRLTQKELRKRGTVTHCFNVFCSEKKKHETILITDKAVKRL